MKIRLKTNFWKETEPEEWRKRYSDLSYGMLLLGMSVCGMGIYNNDYVMIGLGGTQTLITSIIQYAYYKSKKEEGNNNGNKNTNTRKDKQGKEDGSTVQKT